MNEIYKAIYDRLTSQISESVYDHVPQDTNNNDYPFVRLDPVQLQENDADSETGFIGTVQVICYSRYRGSKEVVDLANSVYNALHYYSFADTTSFGITAMFQTSSTTTMLDDGLTRTSIQRFTIIFEPLPS